MRSVVNRIELAGVENLVEILMAFISKPVEARAPLLHETALCQLTAPLTSVISGSNIKIVKSLGSQIGLIAQSLQYSVIDWFHPICTSPRHAGAFYCLIHSVIGVKHFERSIQVITA